MTTLESTGHGNSHFTRETGGEEEDREGKREMKVEERASDRADQIANFTVLKRLA